MTYTQAKQALKQSDKETVRRILDQYGEGVIVAALELRIAVHDIELNYVGHYRSDREFARELAKETGAIDKVPDWICICIDWQQAGNELMMDYCESDGYYFHM